MQPKVPEPVRGREGASEEGPTPRGPRSILHVDMDAFFAAVEVLDNPSLRGRPVIVGGTPEGHGVVSTASYEARKFGVHSAMPAAQAVRLCPHGVFLRPRGGRYEDVSRQVFAVFHDVTPLVEPVSIDEAFLDVTASRPSGPSPSSPSSSSSLSSRPPRPPASRLAEGIDAKGSTGERTCAEAIAQEILERVERETGGLTCSVGVAENKFLAKVASDLRKPRGLVVVPPGGGAAFLAPLPVERLWGVGPRTAERLHEMGLRTVRDVAGADEDDLARILGDDLGRHLHALSLGIDDRPVVTDWESKSISQETTFATFIPAGDREAIERELFSLCDGVAFRLRAEAFWGRTLHLKVRDETFHTVTRSLTLDAPTQIVETIFAGILRLFRERVRLSGRRIRLLGVGTSNLAREPLRQLDLFEEDPGGEERARLRARVADEILRKLGDGAITRARLVERPGGGRSGPKGRGL